MRVLIDTNVVLDYILNREPYGDYAKRIVEACKEKKVSGCIAAHTVPNIFYILRKVYTVEERREILLALCQLFDVSGINADKIQNALKNNEFSDFEDCLQMECAREYHADYIVTRNTADFAASNIPCMESEQMCVLLENDIG